MSQGSKTIGSDYTAENTITPEFFQMLSSAYYHARRNALSDSVAAKLNLGLVQHSFNYSNPDDPDDKPTTATGCIAMQLAYHQNTLLLPALESLRNKYGVGFVLGLRSHCCGGGTHGTTNATLEGWWDQGRGTDNPLPNYFAILEHHSHTAYNSAAKHHGVLKFPRVVCAKPPSTKDIKEREAPRGQLRFFLIPRDAHADGTLPEDVPTPQIQRFTLTTSSTPPLEVPYQVLRSGTKLYKAMTVPRSGLSDQQSLKNSFASGPLWLSSYHVAKSYIDNPPPFNPETHAVVLLTTQLTTDVRLLDIGAKSSIQYLYDTLHMELGKLKKQRHTISERIQNDDNELKLPAGLTLKEAQILSSPLEPLDAEISRCTRTLECLMLATGINCTFREQLILLLKHGISVNNDWPNWCPIKELQKRSVELPEVDRTFFGEVPRSEIGKYPDRRYPETFWPLVKELRRGTPDDQWNMMRHSYDAKKPSFENSFFAPVKVVASDGDAGYTKAKRSPVVILDKSTGTTWGPRKEDLNRLSFSTAIDREILSAIQRTNMAGYSAGSLPSLWHGGGALYQEVALCHARGVISNVSLEYPGGPASPASSPPSAVSGVPSVCSPAPACAESHEFPNAVNKLKGKAGEYIASILAGGEKQNSRSDSSGGGKRATTTGAGGEARLPPTPVAPVDQGLLWQAHEKYAALLVAHTQGMPVPDYTSPPVNPQSRSENAFVTAGSDNSKSSNNQARPGSSPPSSETSKVLPRPQTTPDTSPSHGVTCDGNRTSPPTSPVNETRTAKGLKAKTGAYIASVSAENTSNRGGGGEHLATRGGTARTIRGGGVDQELVLWHSDSSTALLNLSRGGGRREVIVPESLPDYDEMDDDDDSGAGGRW